MRRGDDRQAGGAASAVSRGRQEKREAAGRHLKEKGRGLTLFKAHPAADCRSAVGEGWMSRTGFKCVLYYEANRSGDDSH